MPTTYKYGAKVYDLNPSTLTVQQTVMTEDSKKYLIDRNPDKTPKNKHINKNDDKAIAEAVRNALTGKL